LHGGIVFELTEEHGDKQYDNERRQHCAEARCQRSFRLVQLVTYENADVHGKDSGAALRYRH
jgi:hypothetical protein